MTGKTSLAPAEGEEMIREFALDGRKRGTLDAGSKGMAARAAGRGGTLDRAGGTMAGRRTGLEINQRIDRKGGKRMRILFIRHGDPDYANDTLTEKGRREASALAARAGSV